MKSQMLTLLALIFVSTLSFNACAQMNNNLSINGKIINTTASHIYLAQLMGRDVQPIDTSIIDADGRFQFYTDITDAGYFQLTTGEKQYTILVLEPNEHLKIEVDGSNLIDIISVSGSPNTEMVNRMLDDVNSFTRMQDSLNNEYRKIAGTALQDSLGKVLAERYEELDMEKVKYLYNEIDANPTLASLLFLEQLNIDENLALYEKVDAVLYAKYPKLSFVSDLHTKVQNRLRLAVGRVAPEIELPDTNDQMVKLSDLRGKVVLIDFWASWCGPCRRESPNLVKYYEKYNEMGFEIFSVSLDKKKSDWIRGIREDQLFWTHVSDLRFWSSVAAKNYGVGSIPFTVLIDEEGKVIATGLRGVELEQKLDEIFME